MALDTKLLVKTVTAKFAAVETARIEKITRLKGEASIVTMSGGTRTENL
jgi:hypothetical protein